MRKFTVRRNELKDLVFTGSDREFEKQSIKMIFRALTEPLMDNSVSEGLVLLRLFDTVSINSVIKRLEFSNMKVYSFCDDIATDSILNIEKNDIWEKTEFVMILAPRYCAVLIWDLKTEDNTVSQICLHVNTREITDIANIIFSNANVDLNSYLSNYAPDRRSQATMNLALEKLASRLDEQNKEMILTGISNPQFAQIEDLLAKYRKIYDKSKMNAHEIKNNVSVINLYSGILERRLDETENLSENTKEQMENALRCIKEAAFTISSHISDITAVGETVLEEKQLVEVIDNVVRLSMPKAKSKNISLESYIDEKFRVHADEMKLQSILLNLVFNAIEATNENGRITIRAHEVSPSNNVVISVKDTGCGIAPENIPKIFEENFTTKIDGNGMGLYICKKLAKDQFGDCTLVKTGDDGTEFALTMPTV